MMEGAVAAALDGARTVGAVALAVGEVPFGADGATEAGAVEGPPDGAAVVVGAPEDAGAPPDETGAAKGAAKGAKGAKLGIATGGAAGGSTGGAAGAGRGGTIKQEKL